MVAFTTRMPQGFPGRVSRPDNLSIEPQIIATSGYPTAYGQFVKLVSGAVAALVSGDAVTSIWGLSICPYPSESTSNTIGQAATPPTSGILDVMTRGYAIVPLASGTAVKGAPVYVCNNSADGTVGAISATAATGYVQVPNAYFQGPADANGNVEISLNITIN